MQVAQPSHVLDGTCWPFITHAVYVPPTTRAASLTTPCSLLHLSAAVYLWGTVWTTVDGLVVDNQGGSRGWYNGHRGIWLEHGQENVYTG